MECLKKHYFKLISWNTVIMKTSFLSFSSYKGTCLIILLNFSLQIYVELLYNELY